MECVDLDSQLVGRYPGSPIVMTDLVHDRHHFQRFENICFDVEVSPIAQASKVSLLRLAVNI